MLDLSWSNIMHSNAFNFVLMVGILAWIFKKFNVADVFEGMKDQIKNYVETAKEKHIAAKKELEKIQDEIETLPEELEKIIETANINAESLAKKIDSEIEEKIEKIKQNIEKQIEQEKSIANSTLQKEMFNSSMAKAKEKIQGSLKYNYELHKKINNDFIDKLESMEV